MDWKRKFLIGCFIIFTIILSAFFAYTSFQAESSRPRLPILGQIQNFSLRDTKAQTFELQNLRGKVWIADFFFTTCGDICPMLSKHMAMLSRSFELVPSVALVSITVNPENDSPEVLEKYAQKMKAGQNWYFLTGSREEITSIAVKSFKLGDISEPVFHSAYFTLVDKNGFIRGYYDGTKQDDVNRLFKDAALLLKEKAHGFL